MLPVLGLPELPLVYPVHLLVAGVGHSVQDECEHHSDQTMKAIVIHNVMAEKDPAEVSIVIEGNQVLTGCGNRTKACMLLMGLIYALNLEYPKTLKNTFEVFQKLFLELEGSKLLKEGPQPQKQANGINC